MHISFLYAVSMTPLIYSHLWNTSYFLKTTVTDKNDTDSSLHQLLKSPYVVFWYRIQIICVPPVDCYPSTLFYQSGYSHSYPYPLPQKPCPQG